MPFRFLTQAPDEEHLDRAHRAAIASHSTPIVDKPWDGPGEVAKADAKASVLRHMHAWYEGNNPDQKGSYKFPHHLAGANTPAVIAGVRNGLARLSGSKIPAQDKPGVERHLRRHLEDWQKKNSFETEDVREARRLAAKPLTGRQVAFPAEWRYQVVTKNGKDYFEVEGYATVWNILYEMYDFFGKYNEKVNDGAADATLAKGPDTIFLVNHRGLSMARTTNDSLDIYKDTHGMGAHAFLNIQRTDVRDLMAAIDDEIVTEMSFAFMLLDGEWNDEMDEFEILEFDIDRGDVSAVNYGANPFTSIEARAKAWLEEAKRMPESVRLAEYERCAATITGTQTALQAREQYDVTDVTPAEEHEARTGEEPLSNSVALWRNRLMLEEEN